MINIDNVNLKSFRERKYYKVINSCFGLPHFHHYSKGENIYKYKDDESIYYEDGIYFTDITNIFNYINYGPIIIELTIPEDAIVVYSPEQMSTTSKKIDGWCADKVFINRFMTLTNPKDVIELIELGADVSADNNAIFTWALQNNPLVYYKFYFIAIA